MKVGLWFNPPKKVNGCAKVVLNTIAGLRKLGHEVVENGPGEVNGAIQKGPHEAAGPHIVLGPETVVLPTEAPTLFRQIRHWVQPCDWCVDYFRMFAITAGVTIDAWPAGIDTDQFHPPRGRPPKKHFDALVYYKNVTRQTSRDKLEQTLEALDDMGQTYEVFVYGEYEEAAYIEALRRCRYAVWVVGTESQNIAIMEAWAMGVPTYILDENDFQYGGFSAPGIASSAPYFHPLCGGIEGDMGRFEEFLDLLPEFDPRGFMESNHTLEHGAQRYLDILIKRLL